MGDLSHFPGTTVRVETLPDGKVVATVHWDGVSTTDPIWWGSDEMFCLTPDERTALAAMAPVFAACARRAAPPIPQQPAPQPTAQTGLGARLLARLGLRAA